MVSNQGRNVAPDPWHDFGDSGSKATTVAWINPTAIDMTQYQTLLLELDPGSAFTTSEVKLTICSPEGSLAYAGAQVEWVNIDREGFAHISQEQPEVGLTSGVKVIWSINAVQAPAMQGLDSVFIHITNGAAGAKTMTGIRYRRVGFMPSG